VKTAVRSSTLWWTLVFLLVVIAPTRAGAASAPTPAGESYFVTWSGTAKSALTVKIPVGTPAGWATRVQHMSVLVSGSALVKFDRNGLNRSARVLSETDSYQYDDATWRGPGPASAWDPSIVCPDPIEHQVHRSVVETVGVGSDPKGVVDDPPEKRPDGTWIIRAGPNAWWPGASDDHCLYSSHDNGCAVGKSPPRHSEDTHPISCNPRSILFARAPSNATELETNTPGPDYFSKRVRYNAGQIGDMMVVSDTNKVLHTPQTDVDWTITVRRIGKCRISGEIPLNDDPINRDINDEEIEMGVEKGGASIDPDSGVANLNIRVTCDQVPIKNAVVVVGAEAQKNTGGHQHDTGERRPRGILGGIELTDVLPAIHVKTDGDGRVRLAFKPGKAVSCPGLWTGNCDNLGIAGIYRITARPERFPMRKAEVAVEAKVDGLSPISANPNYVDDTGGSAHGSGDSATATTKQQLVKFATAFHDAQKAHNDQLAACQTPDSPIPQWPIYPLWVIDASLPFGGLYDLGPHSSGAYWATPHQTHGRGDGVDFSVHRRNNSVNAWPADKLNVPICDGYKISPQGWLMMKMMELGEPKYGYWDQSDFSRDSQPWHLHFNQ
jgi:hypothetical protein